MKGSAWFNSARFNRYMDSINNISPFSFYHDIMSFVRLIYVWSVRCLVIDVCWCCDRINLLEFKMRKAAMTMNDEPYDNKLHEIEHNWLNENWPWFCGYDIFSFLFNFFVVFHVSECVDRLLSYWWWWHKMFIPVAFCSCPWKIW